MRYFTLLVTYTIVTLTLVVRQMIMHFDVDDRYCDYSSQANNCLRYLFLVGLHVESTVGSRGFKLRRVVERRSLFICTFGIY